MNQFQQNMLVGGAVLAYTQSQANAQNANHQNRINAYIAQGMNYQQAVAQVQRDDAYEAELAGPPWPRYMIHPLENLATPIYILFGIVLGVVWWPLFIVPILFTWMLYDHCRTVQRRLVWLRAQRRLQQQQPRPQQIGR